MNPNHVRVGNTPPLSFQIADFQEDIIADSLAESVFSVVSHGAQEVFYSDFLAYLATHQPVFFKAVMLGLDLRDDYGRVEREWKKFDLAFFAAPKPSEDKREREAEVPFS